MSLAESNGRNLLLGALRAVLEYVALVMGGTAALAGAARGLRILPSPVSVPGFVTSILSSLIVFLDLLTPAISLRPVLAWIATGVVLFVCGLLLRNVPDSTARLGLAVVSLVLSTSVAAIFSPAYVTVLITPVMGFVVTQAFAAFCAGCLGGIFGFFLLPQISRKSLNSSPMHWGHWVAVTAWILLFGVTWARTESIRHKLEAVKDRRLRLVYARWVPVDDGPVREEPIGPGDRNRYLTDQEIEELRAAGLTGVIHYLGGQGDGAGLRFVVIMARPDRDTVDLPKPASGDILYLQTQEGWRKFPPSAPTLPRTVRLLYFGPDAYFSLPTMRPHVDIGLGHPDPKSDPGAWSYAPADWPDNWQMLPPSLPEAEASHDAVK